MSPLSPAWNWRRALSCQRMLAFLLFLFSRLCFLELVRISYEETVGIAEQVFQARCHRCEQTTASKHWSSPEDTNRKHHYVSQWRMSMVALDCGLRLLVAFYYLASRPLLDIAASCTQSCSVEQSATSLAQKHVTGYIWDKIENVYFPTFTMTFEDHPALLRRFCDFGAVI